MDEYFYVLTIQGSWRRAPSAQYTISGVIQPEPGSTRQQVLNKLEAAAKAAWVLCYYGIGSDGFSVIFFSLEKNVLD